MQNNCIPKLLNIYKWNTKNSKQHIKKYVA